MPIAINQLKQIDTLQMMCKKIPYKRLKYEENNERKSISIKAIKERKIKQVQNMLNTKMSLSVSGLHSRRKQTVENKRIKFKFLLQAS